jgi:tungstate transport system permease protein
VNNVDSLSSATLNAVRLLFTGDPALWTIVGTSFSVSLRAIVIATPPAIAVAFVLAFAQFPGRKMVIAAFNTMLSLPAVVVGLLLYMLFSRAGPAGDLKLLFTSTAMIIGQVVLCFPLLVAMCHAAIQSADRSAWETALTLGASPFQALLTLLHEVRFGLIAAVMAAFGRVIAEVGCSMMVGGNILGYTRNIPTAIALETSKGLFAQGIALGLVLLLLALTLNFGVTLLQGHGEMGD